ncbi:U3-aranetoxin-Ce1a-like [Uloborus diversus]|uniref:U3-aranetoxin-Ce1a-like n=1 Tax=Uloborus diversus TaxID=327109 RepID=UPI00240A4A42|nr:U3-aranetoxin-Ce1a-like [Uloborus diversus]
MRTTILIGFVVCLFIAVGAEFEKCQSNDDCEEGECCVSIIEFLPSRCRKLRQKGDFCLKDFDGHFEDDKYNLFCPCAEGLHCEGKGTVDDEGVPDLEDVCQEV